VDETRAADNPKVAGSNPAPLLLPTNSLVIETSERSEVFLFKPGGRLTAFDAPELEQSWHECVLFRCRAPEHAGDMATLRQKIKAEKRMRDLLEESGLPQPDHVEYGFTCIRLFFMETKTVVVIDIDEPPLPDAGATAASL
jgi:hypothetical protein